jgi:protein phosphatase 1 regulatory subunit 7
MAGATPAGISRALIVERSLGEEDERNVYELSFHNAALRSMLGLSGCVRLRLLDLSFNQIRVVEGIDTLVDLRELRLYGNAIQHVGGLACLRSLKVLLLLHNLVRVRVREGASAQQQRAQCAAAAP